MKQIKTILIGISLVITTGVVNAQLLPSIDFLYGVRSDAKLLMQEYLRPYANILGANLNAGWYNTAEPHKLGGFDITATFSIAFAPTSALSYNLTDLSALNADIQGSTTVAPTIAGEMETLPQLVYTVTHESETYELANITHPNGAGLDWLPLPMAQASIGLIKGTDVSIRFVPETRIGDYGRLGLWGIGGKHSVSQWIPVVKSLKFINISVQGGYTKVSTMAKLNMLPIVEDDHPISTANWDDQYMHMDISGWTLNLIASQSIPIITVYEGIGYSSSLVDLAVLGHYPINTLVTTPDEFHEIGDVTYEAVLDPVPEGDMKFENFKNLRLNAGLRLKLGLLTIHYDFTRTLYSTHTAGIGISFR